MKKLSIFLVLILSFVVNISYANPSNKTTSIEKMFRVMGIDKQMHGGFEAMLPIVDQLSAKLKLDVNAKEELKNIYRNWFENDIDRAAMKSKFIQIYSNAFTENQIKELITFYQSPTGQIFLKKSPGLMKLGAQIGMQEGRSKEPLLIKRLKPFLDKHKK